MLFLDGFYAELTNKVITVIT